MRAMVVANGDVKDYSYIKRVASCCDLVICADGGIRHCVIAGVFPDIWVGDFDSCDKDLYFQKYPQLKKAELITMKPEKDVTDTHAACSIAIEKGCADIIIAASCGTRLDHTLSNTMLLEYICKNGVSASIENENNTVRFCDSSITLKRSRKYLSIIPVDEKVKIVKATGLKYPLENYIMERCLSLGVSNEVIADEAEIVVDGGAVLVVESQD